MYPKVSRLTPIPSTENMLRPTPIPEEHHQPTSPATPGNTGHLPLHGATPALRPTLLKLAHKPEQDCFGIMGETSTLTLVVR